MRARVRRLEGVKGLASSDVYINNNWIFNEASSSLFKYTTKWGWIFNEAPSYLIKYNWRFSRLVEFYKASTNNKAVTVLNCFQGAVAFFPNLPSRVRCDLGLENFEVGRFMLQAIGLNRGSIITATSVHNQGIEKLWRDINRIMVSWFLNIFLYLENKNVLDTSNEMHLFCLHLVYLMKP